MKYISLVCTILFATYVLTSCQKEVILDLPAVESKLVVECYLEPGLPYILSLSETFSIYDVNSLPLVDDATVTIAHNGVTDTLELIDSLGVYVNFTKFVLPNDFEPYELRVEDTKGRVVTATTQLQPVVPIDTVIYLLNDSMQASVVFYFDDEADLENYYKVYFANTNSFNQDSVYTWEFSDQVFSGQKTSIGMGYNYLQGDEIEVRLYSIDYDFYRFLETVNDAEAAAQSPFARPARVESNINGGTGIFAGANYDSWRLIIK